MMFRNELSSKTKTKYVASFHASISQIGSFAAALVPDLKYDFYFHCCKPERVLLHQQRREQTACTCVCVPERLCVISAHFRVHSSGTRLPCDRGKWEVALTDMERCILGLRSERQKHMCREAAGDSHYNFTTASELCRKLNKTTEIPQSKHQNAGQGFTTHTQTHLLVWRAKGVSGKCCKITTKLSRTNAWMNL